MREIKAALSDPMRHWPVVVVGLLPMAMAGIYLAMGAGYVLDDWWLRENARFDGILAVGGDHARQRPAALPFFALAFGVWSGHPLMPVLLMAVGNSVFIVCVVLLLRRVLPGQLAVVVGAVWGLLPTHTSLEVWLSTINIAWSQAFAGLGLVVGWRLERSRWHLVLCGAFMMTATLAYEATTVVAGLAVLALPLAERRRVDWGLLVAAGVGMGLGGLWQLTHWFEGKEVASTLASIDQALQGNTALGLVPPGRLGNLVGAAAVVLLAWAVARLVLPSFRPSDPMPERLLVAGFVVIQAGSIPFALYVYEPFGAGDRSNGLSAVGGALFLVGAALALARLARVALVVGVVVASIGAGFTRVERIWLWHLAGRDADAIVAEVVAQIPAPDSTIYVGPEPIHQDKIVAFLDEVSITAALRLAYDDRRVEAEMTRSEAEFVSTPKQSRVDIRPVSRLDDR